MEEINQETKDTVFGFLRRFRAQCPSKNPFFYVPTLVVYSCILYYHIEPQRIELRVHRHRGHYKHYHPNNLLKDDTESFYQSGSGLADRDWIVFAMQVQEPMLLTTIKIRNYTFSDGIKGISLSIGSESDHHESIKLMEINDIHSDNDEEQEFVIKSLEISNKCNLLRLSIYENHGSQYYNRFSSFSLFGRAAM